VSEAARDRDAIIARLRMLAAPLRARWGIRIIGVFGSVARGEARDDSDVDLLVTYDRPLGLELADAAAEIEAAIGRPVDLASQKWLRPRLYEVITSELIRVDA
jgi:predicted nucleotidyltransferase